MIEIKFQQGSDLKIAESLLNSHGWISRSDTRTEVSKLRSLKMVKFPKKNSSNESDNQHISEVSAILAKHPVPIESISAKIVQPDFHPLPRWTGAQPTEIVKFRSPVRQTLRHTYIFGSRESAEKIFLNLDRNLKVEPANVAALHAEGKGWGSRTFQILTISGCLAFVPLTAIFLYQPFAWMLDILSFSIPGMLDGTEGRHLATMWIYAITMALIAAASVTITSKASAKKSKEKSSKHHLFGNFPEHGPRLPLPALIAALVMSGFVGVTVHDFVTMKPEQDVYKYAALAAIFGIYAAAGAFRTPGSRKFISSLRRLASGTFILAAVWVILHVPSWGYLSGLNLGRLASSRDVNDLLPWMPEYIPTLIAVIMTSALLYIAGNHVRALTPITAILIAMTVVTTIFSFGSAAYFKGQQIVSTGKVDYSIMGYPSAACLQAVNSDQLNTKGSTYSIPVWIISAENGQYIYVGREEDGKLLDRGTHIVSSSAYSLRMLSPSEQARLPQGRPCSSSAPGSSD